MKPRQLAIAVVAAIAAFGVAFAVGKAASGSGEEKAVAVPGKPAEAIELSDASVTAGVQAGGALPALKQRKARRKRRQPSGGGGGGGSAPTTPAPTPAPPPPSGGGGGSSAGGGGGGGGGGGSSPPVTSGGGED